MEEKKPYQLFGVSSGITKEVIEKDAGIVNHVHQTKAADLGILAGEFFADQWKVRDILPDKEGNFDAEEHTLQLVAMTVEEFERLKEIEWMYKDLNDEDTE